MTTITINIDEQTIIDDFAKIVGYSDVDPFTRNVNPKTTTEFVKDYLVKYISNSVSKKRSKEAVTAIIKDTEISVVDKIS